MRLSLRIDSIIFMKRLLSSVLVTSLLLFTGCSEMSSDTKPASPHIVLEKNRFSEPGIINLKFLLKNPDGSYVFDESLANIHTQKIHLIILKNDLSNFYHLHPEHGDQFWTTQVTLNTPGLYQVYANYQIQDRPEQVAYTELSVGDYQDTFNYPLVTPELTASENSIIARLSIDQNAAENLSIHLTKDGKPFTDLKPYLGAAGHFIILEHGKPQTFIHSHPQDEEIPNDGQLDFSATFPESGTYTGFLQFLSQDKLYTLPFTFAVSLSTTAPMNHSGH